MEPERVNVEANLRVVHLEEEELKSGETSFHRFADALPHMVWTAQSDGELDYFNQRWYDFTGATPQETFQDDWWIRFVHPDDRERTLTIWCSAIANGALYEVEHRLWDSTADRYRWFLARAVPARDREDRITKWFGSCTDIDERKQTEGELLFHTSLAQNIVDAVVVTTMNSTILLWNHAAEALYGWMQEEVQGKDLNKLLHTQYPAESRDEWLAEIFRRGSWRGEMRHQRRDGVWLDILAGISLVRDVEGKGNRLVGLLRDITRSKQLARELRESEQQLQAAIDVARLGVWRFDPRTGLLDCSDRCKGDLGFPPGAQISLAAMCERVCPTSENADIEEALSKREQFDKEYQIQWPDGSLHWIVVSGRGQYSKDGQPIGMVGVTLEITERKLGDQRKDTFIGMASHELKTPLTTIKGFTQLLKRQMQRLGLEEQLLTLTKMETQVNALTKLVNELMDVSKIQVGKLEYTWEPLVLDQLVRNVVEMLQQTCSQHAIRVSGECGCEIIGDRLRLEQVFTNLLTNALKYSPLADRVDVLVERYRREARIRVRDYGLGIAPEEQEHIFERFYRADTSKSLVIGGLGMGLYLASEIIEKHGGRITVESKVGEGSTFCVALPFSSQTQQENQR